jgi:hypothetical protein
MYQIERCRPTERTTMSDDVRVMSQTVRFNPATDPKLQAAQDRVIEMVIALINARIANSGLRGEVFVDGVATLTIEARCGEQRVNLVLDLPGGWTLSGQDRKGRCH